MKNVSLWAAVRRVLWRVQNRRLLRAPHDTNLDPRYRGYEIGSYTYGTPLVLDWNQGATLKVGRYCSFANGVTIMLGGEHRTDWVTTYPFNQLFSEAARFKGAPASKGDVIIGNDVWLATDSLILSGVRIGDGAVVAARAVVTRNVPPYAIVAGQPAKVIRYRFSDAEIAALLQIAWWNWPEKKVKLAWPKLMSGDVMKFIETFRNRESRDVRPDQLEK